MILKESWRGLRNFLAMCFLLGAVAMGLVGFCAQDRNEEKAKMKDRVIATAANLVVVEVGEDARDLSFPERARLVMKTSHKHWMFGSQLSEDEEFRLAVTVLLLMSEKEDVARIQREWKFLQALGESLERGTPVDLDDVGDESAGESIGLLAIWKSIVADARGMGKVEFDVGKSQ